MKPGGYRFITFFDVTCQSKYEFYIWNPDVESYQLVYK